MVKSIRWVIDKKSMTSNAVYGPFQQDEPYGPFPWFDPEYDPVVCEWEEIGIRNGTTTVTHGGIDACRTDSFLDFHKFSIDLLTAIHRDFIGECRVNLESFTMGLGFVFSFPDPLPEVVQYAIELFHLTDRNPFDIDVSSDLAKHRHESAILKATIEIAYLYGAIRGFISQVEVGRPLGSLKDRGMTDEEFSKLLREELSRSEQQKEKAIKQVARTMGLSPRTIRNRMKSIGFNWFCK